MRFHSGTLTGSTGRRRLHTVLENQLEKGTWASAASSDSVAENMLPLQCCLLMLEPSVEFSCHCNDRLRLGDRKGHSLGWGGGKPHITIWEIKTSSTSSRGGCCCKPLCDESPFQHCEHLSLQSNLQPQQCSLHSSTNTWSVAVFSALTLPFERRDRIEHL